VTGRQTLKVFISSPSDVRPERLIAEQVVQRLAREFAHHFNIEAKLWEREPLVATAPFQTNITPLRETDIVVVILWSRLGRPLPADQFRGAVTSRIVTGTEWEFEDAWHSSSTSEDHLPSLLLYRKTAPVIGTYEDEAVVREALNQKRLLEDFLARWTLSSDGVSVAGAWSEFSDAGGFEEMLDNHLRALIEQRLDPGTAEESLAGKTYYGRPFRGLLSFEPEDAPIFFGRSRATNELRELLARQAANGCAFMLVMGASGSGKSSLVKAGLLPYLMMPGMVASVALCRWAVLRPSDVSGDPLAALAAAMLSPAALPELTELLYTNEELKKSLTGNPQQVVFAVRQGLNRAAQAAGLTREGEARLTLVVDQLEELFTQDGITPGTRLAIVAALEALARSGLVWIIATMRSDFFDRLETVPALAELSKGEARYLLAPPSEAEIAEIIKYPAREAGLRFEKDAHRGVSLEDDLRKAAARDQGALPLLSFVLDQLWQHRDERQTLTFAAYKALGGLEGALGQQAEAVFQEQPEATRAELAAILRALVTTGADGKATSRWTPMSAFAASAPQRSLIKAFLDPKARLLIADSDVLEGARVRVAHEALLTHWERARDQIAADIRDLELRGRLEQAARRWRAAASKDKNSLVLPPGLPLAEAQALRRRWGAQLPKDVVDFIAKSKRTIQWRRARLAIILTSAAAALPAALVLVWAALVWWGVWSLEREVQFVTVPAGCFKMGSPPTEDGRLSDEGPLHDVCVRGFELGKFSVTQSQWRQVMVHNPDPSQFKGDNRPVEGASWDDAQLFLRLMSFFGTRNYRLPSEAEREYATRASTETARYWGEQADDSCAYANIADQTFKGTFPDYPAVNCNDSYVYTAPVGSFKPNAFGLYDMIGNVWEWVEDCFVDYERIAPANGSIVTSDNCPRRVLRGSSWFSSANNARAAQRGRNVPSVRSNLIGLRLARTLPGESDPPRITVTVPVPFSRSPPSGSIETGQKTGGK
jgi:formylglycine-generating enzyme required for sulfatase activity